MHIKHILITAGLAGLFVAGTARATMSTGVVTFADQAGQPDNSALPGAEYNSGLPAGVTAIWSGWLLHTVSDGNPMSVFPAADLAGDDADILFSQPVSIPSLRVKDTAHGSLFSVMGYRAGVEVWHYDGADDNTWRTVTAGAGIEIDRLVVEGRWNHLDNITVVLNDGPAPQAGSIVVQLEQDPVAGGIEVVWPGTVGFRHQLQICTNMVDGPWLNLGPNNVGIGSTNRVAVDPQGAPSAFFRILADTIPSDEVNAETGVARNGLPTPPPGYVWAPIPAYTDEFNAPVLDTSKWQVGHPYWSGRAPSTYRPENVSVANGKLRIRNSMLQDPSTVANPNADIWVGAGCVTSKNRTAGQGYYEAKVKSAKICMTSAFWFQGKYSEIDVVEQMGVSYNNPAKAYWMAMNTHYYPGGWSNDINTPRHWTMPTAAADEYHVYGVWWKDANTVWMYHNGTKVAEITTGGAFNEPQYMFFDSEVFTWEGLPTPATLQDDTLNAMYVDWVRGWQLVPQ